jgi:hypothetical protein
MAFPRGPLRAPAPPRIRVAVFSVGRRVYVSSTEPSARVTLTDAGDRPLASLGDGAEVTILAWLPGWAGTTRYRVRVMESGVEGWLSVGDLRGTAIPSPVAVAPSPIAGPALRREGSGPSGRRFGQRF